jgi:hypothetical protein
MFMKIVTHMYNLLFTRCVGRKKQGGVFWGRRTNGVLGSDGQQRLALVRGASNPGAPGPRTIRAYCSPGRGQVARCSGSRASVGPCHVVVRRRLELSFFRGRLERSCALGVVSRERRTCWSDGHGYH